MKKQKRNYDDFDDTIGKPHKIFCPNCQQWLPAGRTIHTCYDYHANCKQDPTLINIDKTILTRGQLCKLLEDEAKLYLKDIESSIKRNYHLFSFRGKVNKKLAIAVLVDYINNVAAGQGGDLGLMEKHLIGKTK